MLIAIPNKMTRRTDYIPIIQFMTRIHSPDGQTGRPTDNGALVVAFNAKSLPSGLNNIIAV